MRWSIKNSFSKRNYRLLRKKRIIGSNLPKSFRNTIWNWQTRVQMKKNFICTKKSVRTFKLRIEPSFLSHAERGKPFWIREFLAGMRLCRACGATPFQLPIPIFNFGGSERIRTSEALANLPVFKTGAFNHSATLPFCRYFYKYPLYLIIYLVSHDKIPMTSIISRL